MSHRAFRSCIGIIAVLSVTAIARPALAGRCAPLCRAFEIGDARSLPWGTEWWRGRPDYNLANLVSDTEALLGPSTPVIVRVETIRRTSIYASSDRKVAEQLFTRLMERARAAEQAGRPDALAFFDAAYVANTLYQIGEFDDVPEVREQSRRVNGLVRDVDAYALVKKSLALRQDDPELQFGAALIASLKEEHHTFSREHAAKARAGAAGHPLLVRNLQHVS